MTTPPTTGPEAILAALQGMNIDDVEKEQRDIIRAGSKTKRSRAVRMLNILHGLRVNELRPEHMMLTSVPVIPPKFRPFSVTGDTFLPGDSNEVYRDLLEYRRLYSDTEKAMGRDGAAEAYMDMTRAAKAAYGYGESPNPKTRAREVKGFFKMVTGMNPKTSFTPVRCCPSRSTRSAAASSCLTPTWAWTTSASPRRWRGSSTATTCSGGWCVPAWRRPPRSSI